MGRLGAGLFFAVHALITAAIWIPPQRELAGFGPRASWLFAGNRPTMVTLAVTASAAFALAAVGMFAHQDWWAPAAILGALVSLALIAATFTPWWSAAVVINAALIYLALNTVTNGQAGS
jgi:hypothetical protein